MPVYAYHCDKCDNPYEQFLPMAECKKKTRCPTCKKFGKRDYSIGTKGPTFTDKLYPYWDKALNKVFNSPQERKGWLKANGYEEKPRHDHMNRKQERMMYDMRLGAHDPRLRRYAK